MTEDNALTPPKRFKVNQADPRFQQQFLQFSHDMYQWRQHVNDDKWWLQREHACLMLFEKYGYDLLSGGWYCLIKLHRSGWQGLSKATLLFAQRFSGGQPACWPPQSAKLLRRQMLDNYGQQVLPLIHQLPMNSLSIVARKQLLSALLALVNHAKSLQCQHVFTLRLVIANINSASTSAKRLMNKSEELDSLATNTSKNVAETSLMRLTTTIYKQHFLSKHPYLKGAVIGAVLALSSTLLLSMLREPIFLALSNKIWPNNPWYTARLMQYQQMSQSLAVNNSQQKLVKLLDSLEQRLIASERRTQPYMTISELKTSIYDARKLLDEQPLMIEKQLDALQMKKQKHLAISNLERQELQQRIQALHASLILLEYQ